MSKGKKSKAVLEGGIVEGEGDEEYEIHPQEGRAVPKRFLYEEKSKPKVITGTPCIPGQKICIANEYFEAGEGTYEFGNTIYAAALGWLEIEDFPEQELTIVSVKRRNDVPPFTSPYVGALVTCTVINRTKKLARCVITHVGSVKLDHHVRGIIRREYIAEKHRDLAEIETSFGVGDAVLCRIVGIGEGDFIMSTAEDGLGVATAISDAGYYMVPVGWTKMECPKTKQTVLRKVAKIVQDRNLEYWHDKNLELRSGTVKKEES